MKLVYLSLAWVLGIYLGSKYDFPWGTVSILLGISTLFVILSYRKKALLWGGLCLILLLAGILRFQIVHDGDELQEYRGFHEVRGVVAADPEVKEYATTLRLEAREIREVDGEWESVTGTVLVYAPKFPELSSSRDFPYYRYGELSPF